MRNSKLILVEGMPGTGKSTTSQLITLQMRAQGLASKWYPEEHQSRPVQWYYYPKRYPSFADYTEEVISRWRAYANQLQDGQRVNVLDAAILQNHVRSLMIFNCSLPTILELVAGIESQIAALNPLFIYLYPRNIDDNFREVIAVRGSRMLDLWIKAHNQYPYSRKSQLSGRAGFLAFWNEFGRTSDRIFENLTVSKLRLTVSRTNGDAQNRELSSFLDLPLRPPASSHVALERYAGTYAPIGDDTLSEFILEVRDGHFVAIVDDPTIDVARGPIGCFREVRIVPITDQHFYVEGWPYEVRFSGHDAGDSVTLTVTNSEDGWANSTDVYVRH